MLVYVLEIHSHTQQYLTMNMAKILYDSFGGSREMLACHQPQVNYMTVGFGRLSLHGIFPGIAGQNQTPTIGSYRVQPSTIWLVSSPCLRAVTRQLENDQEISMSIFLKCQPIRDDLPRNWSRKKPPGNPYALGTKVTTTWCGENFLDRRMYHDAWIMWRSLGEKNRGNGELPI